MIPPSRFWPAKPRMIATTPEPRADQLTSAGHDSRTKARPAAPPGKSAAQTIAAENAGSAFAFAFRNKSPRHNDSPTPPQWPCLKDEHCPDMIAKFRWNARKSTSPRKRRARDRKAGNKPELNTRPAASETPDHERHQKRCDENNHGGDCSLRFVKPDHSASIYQNGQCRNNLECLAKPHLLIAAESDRGHSISPKR